MPTVSVNRAINAPSSAVWAVLNDFGSIHQFHPAVNHSERTNSAPMGVGAERTCQFDNGPIHERVVGYEPGRRMEIEIYETGPFPLKSAVATFLVEVLDGGTTRITMTTDFTPKFGPVGRLMGPMMKAQFGKMMDGILKGLEDFVVSGATAGASTPVPAAQP
ncbi:MAG: SRPBCC family protein [Bacteroidota bacterium]